MVQIQNFVMAMPAAYFLIAFFLNASGDAADMKAESTTNHPLVNLDRIGVAIEEAMAPGLFGIRLHSLENYSTTMIVTGGNLQSVTLQCSVKDPDDTLKKEIDDWHEKRLKHLFSRRSSVLYGAEVQERKVGILVSDEGDTFQICFTRVEDFTVFADSMKQAFDDEEAMQQIAEEIFTDETAGSRSDPSDDTKSSQ